MKNHAVLLLAGSSTRYGGDLPKIFVEVNQTPLFVYPLLVLSRNEKIDNIILVIKEEFRQKIQDSLIKFNLKKHVKLILGGSSRGESVQKAVNSLSCDENDNILICDGDRPNLTDELINKNIQCLEKYDGCVTAVKAIDSTFIVDEGISYLNRSNLWNAQTPQSFKFFVLKNIYKNDEYKNFTDDASLAIKKEYNIGIVEGSYSNFKITTKADLKRFVSEK